MNNCLFATSSSFKVLLFASIFSVISALPWSEPKPTVTYVPGNCTPRPTQGSISERELFDRRACFFAANTCGWIGGVYISPILCPLASSCVWDTTRSFVGCCPLNAPCSTGVYTGCVDPQSGQQTVIDPAATTCSNTSICQLNSFPVQYYQYVCGLPNMAATVESTFFGQPISFHLQVVTTSLDIPAASTIPGTVNQPAETTSGGSSNLITTPVASYLSEIPTGQIAESVIGGVVGLILLIVLVTYLLRKRKEYIGRCSGRNNTRL